MTIEHGDEVEWNGEEASGPEQEPDHFLASAREFLEAHPEDESARDAFARWYDLVRNNRFDNFGELRRTFPSADLVGDLVVFNIRGNRYRLVARVLYEKGRVYIRHVLTHAAYDRGDWKEPTP